MAQFSVNVFLLIDTYAFSEREITRGLLFGPTLELSVLECDDDQAMPCRIFFPNKRATCPQQHVSLTFFAWFYVVITTWYLEQKVLGFTNQNLVIPRILVNGKT